MVRCSSPPWYVYVNQSAKFDLADWDEDGDMDIISGDWYAFINYFENVTSTGINDQDPPDLPLEFSLKQNYPNPFNPSTKIKFTLKKREIVTIEVFNALGQKIETLLNNAMNAGQHEIEFTGKNLSSGLYLYRIQAGQFQDVKKMVLLR